MSSIFIYEKRKELKFAIHFITKANKHVEAMRYACLHKTEYWSSLNYVWLSNWNNLALYLESILKGVWKEAAALSSVKKSLWLLQKSEKIFRTSRWSHSTG